MKIRISLILLVILISLFSNGNGVAQAQPVSLVDIQLLMESGVVTEQELFVVAISLESDSLIEISALQVYLDFDPTVLQLVAGVNNVIEPGAPFASGRFKDVIENTVSNSSGQVNFAGGKGVNGLNTWGPFLVGAMEFRAIDSAPITTISLVSLVPRQTKVVSGLSDVTGTLNGVSFEVIGNVSISLVDRFKSLP